jgi:hypothetical protein
MHILGILCENMTLYLPHRMYTHIIYNRVWKDTMKEFCDTHHAIAYDIEGVCSVLCATCFLSTYA